MSSLISILLYRIFFQGNYSQFKHFCFRKRALKSLASVNNRHLYKLPFRQFVILTFPALYNLELFIFIKKNQSQFLDQNYKYSYNSQHTNKLHFPLHHLTLSELGFFYSVIMIFNKLPNEVTYLKSEDVFRANLKKC